MTYEQPFGVNVRWIKDTSEGCREDEEGDDDEEEAIDEARENLNTVIPITQTNRRCTLQ